MADVVVLLFVAVNFVTAAIFVYTAVTFCKRVYTIAYRVHVYTRTSPIHSRNLNPDSFNRISPQSLTPLQQHSYSLSKLKLKLPGLAAPTSLTACYNNSRAIRRDHAMLPAAVIFPACTPHPIKASTRFSNV